MPAIVPELRSCRCSGTGQRGSPGAATPAAAKPAAAAKGAGEAGVAAGLVVLAGGRVGQLELAVPLPVEGA